MEGAQSHIARAPTDAPQAHILADHADNVDRRLQVFDELHLKGVTVSDYAAASYADTMRQGGGAKSENSIM